VQAGVIQEADRAGLHRVLLNREQICGTAVGRGAAIPHAYFAKLPQNMVVLARLRRPIDYASPDRKPVDLLFLLLGPQRVAEDHLQILGKIARLIKDEKFDRELRRAATPAAALAALRATEDRHR
jgi:PTS system nitrogen regulatory IIA component